MEKEKTKVLLFIADMAVNIENTKEHTDNLKRTVTPWEMVDSRVKYKMSRKRLVVPASKKVLETKRVGACQRESGASMKEPPVARARAWAIRQIT